MSDERRKRNRMPEGLIEIHIIRDDPGKAWAFDIDGNPVEGRITNDTGSYVDVDWEDFVSPLPFRDFKSVGTYRIPEDDV